MIAKGSLVRVSGPPGEVLGRIEEIHSPEDLPDLPGAEDLGFFLRAMLIAEGYRAVALISHFHNGDRVVFAAKQDAGGQWWDLREQRLAVTEEKEGDRAAGETPDAGAYEAARWWWELRKAFGPEGNQDE